MSVARNIYADIPEDTAVTAAAAEFVESVRFEDLPEEALRIGTRCLLDGLGLFVAGSDHGMVDILRAEAADIGGRPDARLLGHSEHVPAAMAARVALSMSALSVCRRPSSPGRSTMASTSTPVPAVFVLRN